MSRSVVARARAVLAACATTALAAAGAVTLLAAPAAAATGTVSEGTLSWGVRVSFLNYIEGPIAQGQVSTDGVTESGGVFGFAGGTGTADTAADQASVAFDGAIHFQGHKSDEPGVYILDLLIEDLEVQVAGPDEVYLVADVASRPLDSMTEPSEVVVQADVPLVRVAADAVSITDELISAEAAATTLTDEGAAAFGGFYPAGDAMDPVSFSLPVTIADDGGSDGADGADDASGADGTDGADGADGTDESAGSDDAEDATGGAGGATIEDEVSASTSLEAASTSLTWGLKASFVSYIQGPIASGEIATEGGATFTDGLFTLTDGTGSGDSEAGTAVVSYPGSLHFTGHDGLLDLTISDLRLRIDSPTSGTVVASMVSRSLETGEFETFTGIDLATLTLGEATVAEGQLKLTDAPATLTAAGAEGFAGFYAAGAELDPVTAEVTFTPTEVDTTPDDPQVPDVPEDPTDYRPSSTDGPAEGDEAGTTNAGAGGTVAQDSSATETAAPVCTANAVSGASLTWGLKSSFRSYISGGIANGGWTTAGGISDVSGGWTWSGGTGSINPETLAGTVSYPGTLHFTGHDGILDMQISKLSLRMTGPTTASLYATVVSNDMEGNSSTHAGIQFATLTFPAVTAGSGISIADATVTLTAAGADGFAGFYEPGTALDSLDAELPVGGAVDCSAAAGTTLAMTGPVPVAPLLALAGLLLVIGAALTVRRSALR